MRQDAHDASSVPPLYDNADFLAKVAAACPRIFLSVHYFFVYSKA